MLATQGFRFEIKSYPLNAMAFFRSALSLSQRIYSVALSTNLHLKKLTDLEFDKFRRIVKLFGFNLSDERLVVALPALRFSIEAMEQLLVEDLTKDFEPTNYLSSSLKSSKKKRR